MQTLKSALEAISSSNAGYGKLQSLSYSGLDSAQKKSLETKGFESYTGKVRELIRTKNELYIIHTDRLSAYDKHIGLVPYKGIILSEISRFWLEQLSDIVPTHYKSAPNQRTLQVKSCTPIKAEIIVRGYMTGSMQRAYEKGVRDFCGCQLPDNIKNFQKLDHPIITPTTKAEVFEHDEETTPSKLIEMGVCTLNQWQTIESLALKMFKKGQDLYDDKGWILVDTKYEFGLDEENNVIVIDEVHTPDSSRLWVKSTYEERLRDNLSPEMLDKEVIRRFLADNGFNGSGKAPEVPSELLVRLAQSYLRIAESLLDSPIMYDTENRESLINSITNS